ncbi:phosphoribulokinase [Parasulfuritortus cantonensis]|uniref:Phosphoribulokinase n=1 Tax=Parasulfuritortus cantonensis TaxID=2528202 RepID=A0A4R1BEJ1_9PROT|nr:phosphoribulokinase [Parasulfuritortus cantonensis]TCJ15530.1 phosphoribulokinase [Parasulfuritortus cantonensis]
MSVKHPIVAVTGSTGAGLSFVRHAFKDIFRRLGIKPALIHGDSFRRYTERQFQALLHEARESSRHLSWFGPECNYLAELEALFRTYGTTGNGISRDYAHNDDHAVELGVPVGEFTAWHPLTEGSDILLYEGQHGGVKADTWTRRRESFDFPPDIDRRKNAVGIDVAKHVDLLIGIVPAINLEWIQKIHRDCDKHRCTPDESVETILRRLDDYIHYIVPQFALTDINIQRIPLVDTSNPFVARDVPAADESALVIHFRDRQRHNFRDIMDRIPGARMTRPSTLLVPGGKLRLALAVICGPILEEMMDKRAAALAS